MKINLVVVGKMKQTFAPLFKHYAAKIAFFTKLNIIEVKEAKNFDPKTQIKKETQAILEAIPKNSQVFLCALKGEKLTSENFVALIEQDNVTFVIGGSHGVDTKQFDHFLSFSPMTFPHQLFRIMLVEQIYRAFTIKNNLKYHK